MEANEQVDGKLIENPEKYRVSSLRKLWPGRPSPRAESESNRARTCMNAELASVADLSPPKNWSALFHKCLLGFPGVFRFT